MPDHRALAGAVRSSARAHRQLGGRVALPRITPAAKSVLEEASKPKDAGFKRVVRRHAEETGQRYTGALTDLEGLQARIHHEPDPGRLLEHLRDHYGIEPVTATKLSVHKTYVFRIDRRGRDPWVARAFPPARPRAGVEGDAAILGLLEREGYRRTAS